MMILPEPIPKLVRSDIRAAVAGIGRDECRFLVDTYYQIQEYRKATANQTRAAAQGKEPAQFIGWVFNSLEMVEETIRKGLDDFTTNDPVGRWAKSITGIGPVISAGLLAHIDIEKAPTVGHIWRFAGYDPTVEWKKGQKRPWNADLKTLCWKIGESFVKFSNNPNDFYGRFYRSRKQLEESRNAEGTYAAQAALKLERFKIGADTQARAHYESGKLPPGHIHARCKRYAVKLFLAHWHHVAYLNRYKTEPPKPYALEHLEGHHDLILPPNLELLN
jgi:hypothetical protein